MFFGGDGDSFYFSIRRNSGFGQILLLWRFFLGFCDCLQRKGFNQALSWGLRLPIHGFGARKLTPYAKINPYNPKQSPLKETQRLKIIITPPQRLTSHPRVWYNNFVYLLSLYKSIHQNGSIINVFGYFHHIR